MEFNIETFLERANTVLFISAVNEIQNNTSFRNLTPTQLMNSARSQFEIVDRVNSSGNPETIQGMTDDGTQQVEINTENVDDILEQALTIYMIGLVMDYNNGGTQYLSETPSISIDVMNNYRHIFLTGEELDDITDILTDDITDILTDDMSDTKEYQVHNVGEIKPTMKLSVEKKYHIEGWWN